MQTAQPVVSDRGVGSQTNYGFALSALTTLFFLWGFMTCLNDILIPHLKAIFTLSYAQAALIQFVFFIAYFLVSLPAGTIVRKIGYKNGIVSGLFISGVGCLLFMPASSMQSYPLFLCAFFVLAAGITILQVAANPYVAELGSPETSSARLNLTQAFNSLGTTLAPLFGSALILSVAIRSSSEIAKMTDPERIRQALETNAHAVQKPYLGLGILFLIVSVVFFIIKLPKIVEQPPESSPSREGLLGVYMDTLRQRHLALGVLAIFFYVGGEVSIGSFLVNYMKEMMGFEPEVAGRYLMLYWGGAMAGRFIGAVVLRTVKPGLVLGLNAAIVCVLLAVSMSTKGQIAVWSALGIGFFNSIMFPTIFTLAITGLKDRTSTGSALLCMGIVGGAVLPWVTGILADNIGLQLSFVIPLGCYIYIIYYGLRGSLVR